MVGMIRLGSTRTTGSNLLGFKVRFQPGTIFISDPIPTTQPLLRTVNVVTRSGTGKTDNSSDAPASSGEKASVSSPPPEARTRSRSIPVVPSAPMEMEMLPPSRQGVPGAGNSYELRLVTRPPRRPINDHECSRQQKTLKPQSQYRPEIQFYHLIQ
jgi:hypothetical protein